MSVAVCKNFCSGKFLQTIIKVFVADFVFSKIPCVEHILLNTFRRMRLKHENYSLSVSYFRHLNNQTAKASFQKLLMEAHLK